MFGSNKYKKMVDDAARNLDKAFKVENNTSVTDKLNIGELMSAIGSVDVLVGIPESTSVRQRDEKITNAELAFLHTHGVRKPKMRLEMQKAIDAGKTYTHAYQMYIQAHGSPAYHVPPRPIIEPAIEAHIEQLSAKMRQALESYLSGDIEEGMTIFNQVGMKAQNYARAWFTDPRNNWAPNSPATIALKKSDKPLIDTGEMRKSITYVVVADETISERKIKENVRRVLNK